jgi:hypothetical protein
MFNPIWVIAFLFISVASAAETSDSPEITLSPIIKDASPLDFLAQDPIVPVQEGVPRLDTGEGTLVHTFTDELPYSSTDPGSPGSLSQFRGLGRSSDETNVQSLGIPLNGPQGGGFDFSTFPQFFWADYRFQPGPSSASFDPRGISGTLNLVPWTAKALSDSESSTRVTGLYSDADLQQISVGAKYQDRVAILVGNSSGLVNGPSASLSAKVYESKDLTIQFHLLTTDIDAEIDQDPPEPIAAHQTSLRTIPVLQADWKVAPEVLVKSSIYYDNSYIRYDDPSYQSFSRGRAQQLGWENAVYAYGWKIGASSREIAYNAQVAGESSFTAPDENISTFQLARLIVLAGSVGNQLILEPTFQTVNDSDYGFLPEGTIGLRQEWDQSHSAVYVKGNFSRRIPSVVDRFYNIPAAGGFPAQVGNPNLLAEKDLTGILGVQTRQSHWDASLQGYYQVRYNAQVPLDSDTVDTLINSDNAHLFSIVATAGWTPLDVVHFYESANFTHSEVNALQSPFPYIPDFIDLLGMNLTFSSKLSADFQGRIQSSAFISSTSQVDPSAYVDMGVSYALSQNIRVMGRIENLTDAQLVFEPQTPPKGRILSVALLGSL